MSTRTLFKLTTVVAVVLGIFLGLASRISDARGADLRVLLGVAGGAIAYVLHSKYFIHGPQALESWFGRLLRLKNGPPPATAQEPE